MLNIVATPIGNYDDISLRVLNILKECDVLIGEEFRVASTLLKKLKLEQKEIFLLNEHSKHDDLNELVELCRVKNVALISDCGTPVFSDPGAELIAACRKAQIPITAMPGASALMTLISLSSRPLKQFLFLGFLPAKNEERLNAIRDLKTEKRSWIIMDTPYRLQALLKDLASEIPNDRALIGLDLTKSTEQIFEGTFKVLHQKCASLEGEFIILRY